MFPKESFAHHDHDPRDEGEVADDEEEHEEDLLAGVEDGHAAGESTYSRLHSLDRHQPGHPVVRTDPQTSSIADSRHGGKAQEQRIDISYLSVPRPVQRAGFTRIGRIEDAGNNQGREREEQEVVAEEVEVLGDIAGPHAAVEWRSSAGAAVAYFRGSVGVGSMSLRCPRW